jgi:hypothetical protein
VEDASAPSRDGPLEFGDPGVDEGGVGRGRSSAAGRLGLIRHLPCPLPVHPCQRQTWTEPLPSGSGPDHLRRYARPGERRARRSVTTASRICPAAAMSSSPVAASAITWCDSGPWWTRARSRYLQPDFRCLCCKRRRSRASARTRYLQGCLRRTGTDVTRVTCVYPLLAAALDVSRLIRTVRRGHVTAAEALVTGTFSMGTSDNRAPRSNLRLRA